MQPLNVVEKDRSIKVSPRPLVAWRTTISVLRSMVPAHALALSVALIGARAAQGAEPPPVPEQPVDYASLFRFERQRPQVITVPDRIAFPPEAAMERAYPGRALKSHINGRADLSCKIGLGGRATECSLVWEAPEGYGFGRAALSLAPQFTFRPGTVDGVAVAGFSVTQVIRFAGFPTEPEPPGPPSVFTQKYAPFGSRAPAPPEIRWMMLPQGRLAIVGVTPGGEMSFVGLDDQVWQGRTAEVTWLEIAARPKTPEATFKVWRLRVDCFAGAHKLLRGRFFDGGGQPDGWDLPGEFGMPPGPAKPPDATTPIGRIAGLVCAKADLKYVVTGFDRALSVAREWPG